MNAFRNSLYLRSGRMRRLGRSCVVAWEATLRGRGDAPAYRVSRGRRLEIPVMRCAIYARVARAGATISSD